MKIALFGGTFNPFHTDHLSMIKTVQAMNIVDEIWIIPTNQNPFKDSINVTNEDRLAMIKLGIKELKNVKIKTLELTNTKPSTTIETVKKLIDKTPNNKFYFMLGSDNLHLLHKWEHIEDLINLQTFLFFDRNNDISDEDIKKYHAIKINFVKNLLLSSSEIRNGSGLEQQIKSIVNYINKKGLYLEDRLRAQNLPADRITHCLNVGQMAIALAQKYQLNETEALVAGTLHDITKNWPLEKHLAFMKKYDKNNIHEPIPTLHAYSGAIFLTKKLLFSNKSIINAVKYHTVGHSNIDNLGMVIFIADKISKERHYDKVDEYRQLAFQDLKKCYFTLLTKQYENAVNKFGYKNIGKNILLSLKKKG